MIGPSIMENLVNKENKNGQKRGTKGTSAAPSDYCYSRVFEGERQEKKKMKKGKTCVNCSVGKGNQ